MNKYIFLFIFKCLGLFASSISVSAQTDSLLPSRAYERILIESDFSIGQIRGFHLGDSMAVISRSEKAILEAQGDDFLYYRILCDSNTSAEISYTFDAQGLLISIGIEFFESCTGNSKGFLSDEFSEHLLNYYTHCIKDETDTFECISGTGLHMDYQKRKSEMCVIHTEIEFF